MKPDPADSLVVVEVELVVVEIVALQCLEVDLVPANLNCSSVKVVNPKARPERI